MQKMFKLLPVAFIFLMLSLSFVSVSAVRCAPGFCEPDPRSPTGGSGGAPAPTSSGGGSCLTTWEWSEKKHDWVKAEWKHPALEKVKSTHGENSDKYKEALKNYKNLPGKYCGIKESKPSISIIEEKPVVKFFSKGPTPVVEQKTVSQVILEEINKWNKNFENRLWSYYLSF